MGPPRALRPAVVAIVLVASACSAGSRPAGTAADEAARVTARRSFCGHVDELAGVLSHTLNRIEITVDDVDDLERLERDIRDDATLYEAVRFSPAEEPDYPRVARRVADALGEVVRVLKLEPPAREVAAGLERVLEALFGFPERYCARAGLADRRTPGRYAEMATTSFCLNVTRTGDLFKRLQLAAPPPNAELASQLDQRRRVFELDRRLFLEGGDDVLGRVADAARGVLERWVAGVRAGGAPLEELDTLAPELAAVFRQIPPDFCRDVSVGPGTEPGDAVSG